jgi:putative tryptophan/tyrosine transport system substrate-binding protein
VKRRAFIAGLVAAAALPSSTRAEAKKVVGLLMPLAAGDSAGQERVKTFLAAMRDLGWIDGRNMRVDLRWAPGGEEEVRKQAAELVALAPDVVITNGSAGVRPLLKVTRAVPIVFAVVADPIGAGFVKSLARPGGNATGFLTFETGLSVKWLELLREIAPRVTRAAVLYDPTLTAIAGQLALIRSTMPSVGIELTPVDARNAGDIGRAIAQFAGAENGGLIVTPSASSVIHRDFIVQLAAKHRLPAVYPARYFSDVGGLLSYGPDLLDQYRHAAGYVNRILKGEKPGMLPVQAPTKYELVVNLKTAKALDLPVPPNLLDRADVVIE